MKSEQFARRVGLALNQGLQEIPPAASRRLEAARHQALERQKLSQAQLALSTGAGAGWTLRFGSSHRYLRNILSISALLLGMWIAFYWHSHQYVTEIGDVDSALLADELPPEAFLDNDFFEWLKDSPEE
ncbi:MAG TPA: DUF3619 family protein [Rhodocyclaceae bacterium]|jgi:hypothetical protein|nr:DUF3619 family protein [Rhodocyclaceae bacterium]